MLLGGSDRPEGQGSSRPCPHSPTKPPHSQLQNCLIHENHTSQSTQLSSAHLPEAGGSCELSGSLAQSCDGFVVSTTASRV